MIHPDTSKVERMRAKWTPELSPQALTDCEEVLAQLLAADHVSLEIKLSLSSVKIQEYALLTLVWRYNSFGHHTDSNALCMFDVTSMMAHSCGASGVWHFGADDSFCLRARVGLRPGDEICISYLADEDLFKSANIRKEKTHGWLFACNCVRCEGPPIDFSRGFRCPTCVVGSVFFSTSGIPNACSTCATPLSEKLVSHYLELEPLYVDRLVGMDKTNLNDIEAVKKEAVNLFANHWIVVALDSLIADCLKTDPAAHQRRLLILVNRLSFLKQTYPMANYTTAWLLEELGDIYEKMGLKSISADFFEDAYWTMRVMCGQDHPFTETIQGKWDAAVAVDSPTAAPQCATHT